MRSLIAGFAVGVCLLQMQGSLPGYGAALLLAALGLAFILLLMRTRRYAPRVAMLASCGAVAGFVWAAGFAQCYLADELPKELEGQDIIATGTIDSLPYRFDQGQRFNFAIEHAEADGMALAHLPQRVALSWYAHQGEEEVIPVNVQPGERWRLQRPHGTANIGGFDYEVWLLEQHLRATGTVRTDAAAAAQNVRQDAFVWSAHNLVQSLRAGMRDRILVALPGERYAGMVVALVIGDERGVGQSDWKVVNRSGIGHLVAISGLRTSKS
jgi:competence protein ComEC